MRIKNSFRNIFLGIGSQLTSVVVSFATRTIFINILGAEYLGIEGLFSNILSLLSLSNLGIESAIIFSLYRPLSQNNENEIIGYMNFYRRVYKIVGIITFIIGLLLIPYVNSSISNNVHIKENIIIIYLMFLLNASISYLYIYKQSILIASQQNHLISKIHMYFIIISNLLQMIILIFYKSYILVLAIQLIFRVIENIFVSKQAEKKFPFLKKENNYINLPKEKKKDLYKNVYSMLLYKISGTVINSTDNLVISYFVGIIYVGIYSNYLLIISIIRTFASYIFYPITASVGNLLTSGEEEKKKFMFEQILFSSFWVYGFCSISLYILFNDFINLWIGSSYILDSATVFVIILNFYTTGMQSAATMYRDTSGLFNIGKYRPLIAAVINLTISFVLAKSLGIKGVLLGTIISRMCVYFWFDPYVIYKYIFKDNVKEYFKKYINYTLVLIFASIITYIISNCIDTGNIYFTFLFKLLVCSFIPNIIFVVLFWKNKHLVYIKNIFLYLIEKVKL